VHVTHLSLTDFRSYARAEVPLGPGATTIVGRNGQGKTNLVEALGYAATLGSHRVATDAPLVRTGAERAVVRAAVDRAGRSTLVELEIVPGRANRARVNRSPVARPRDVLGSLRTVLFAPEDLALVKGEPDGRRRYLDEVLVALAPRLAGVRADYDRVLRQRNTLLRTARAQRVPPAALEVWDEHLASAGAQLLFSRLHLVRRVAPHVAAAYAAVSGHGEDPGGGPGADAAAGSPVRLGYRCSVPEVDGLDVVGLGAVGPGVVGPDGTGAGSGGGGDAGGAPELPGRAELAEALLRALAAQRRAEVERGTSLVGPHRDDLVLTLDGLPARGYASHGESWSFALALRLGSYALLRGAPVGAGAAAREASGASADDEPVLVLDDVFAELDAGRRRRLAALVAGAEQVLITAAVDDDVPAGLEGERLRVADGEVVRDG
jgi:DNA replication and repair protein RecF